MDSEEASMLALGDQVEAAVNSSRVSVAAFILISIEGAIEYRSRLNEQALSQALHIAAEAILGTEED